MKASIYVPTKTKRRKPPVKTEMLAAHAENICENDLKKGFEANEEERRRNRSALKENRSL